MNLSSRERRMISILGLVLLAFALSRVLLGGEAVEQVPDLFASPSPVVVIPSSVPSQPVFVVPPGARDPFKS